MFQIKVHQFYIRMVVLEHLQVTVTLCLIYIYLKPPKYIMCDAVLYTLIHKCMFYANTCKGAPKYNKLRHQPGAYTVASICSLTYGS